MTCEYIFRVVVVGDAGVGKTSLCQRLCHNQCPPNYESTIGVEFYSHVMPLRSEGQQQKIDATVKLQLWDTAGMDGFRTIIKSYYRSATLVFLVYDCTYRPSFNHLVNWLQDVRSTCDPRVIVTVVANKTDLHLQSQVTHEEGMGWAQAHDLLFAETSSKVGLGVDSCFYQAVRQMYQQIKVREVNPDHKLGIKDLHGPPAPEVDLEAPTPLPGAFRLCHDCVML